MTFFIQRFSILLESWGVSSFKFSMLPKGILCGLIYVTSSPLHGVQWYGDE